MIGFLLSGGTSFGRGLGAGELTCRGRLPRQSRLPDQGPLQGFLKRETILMRSEFFGSIPLARLTKARLRTERSVATMDVVPSWRSWCDGVWGLMGA